MKKPEILTGFGTVDAEGVPKSYIGSMANKFRWPVVVLFLIILGLVAFGQTLLDYSFGIPGENYINQVFPIDTLVIVYDASNESLAPALIEHLDSSPHVRTVLGLSNTIKAPLSVLELAYVISDGNVDAAVIAQMQSVFTAAGRDLVTGTMTLYEYSEQMHQMFLPSLAPQALLFALGLPTDGASVAQAQAVFNAEEREYMNALEYVAALYAFMSEATNGNVPASVLALYQGITQSMTPIQDLREQMVETLANLSSTDSQNRAWSRIMVTLGIEPDSVYIIPFIRELETFMQNVVDEYDIVTEARFGRLGTNFFFIGEGAMSGELERGFSSEYLLISLLLTAALFVVMVIAFRKVLLPLILVGTVQTAVWMMMAVMALTGMPIYFMALFIVQSVVKGSALEWGVLLSNSYIEARHSLPKNKAINVAIKNSSRVTLTSAIIMIIITSVLGVIMDGAIASIMLGLGIASGAAAVLTMLTLPSFLVIFDRFVIKPKKNRDGGAGGDVKNGVDVYRQMLREKSAV